MPYRPVFHTVYQPPGVSPRFATEHAQKPGANALRLMWFAV